MEEDKDFIYVCGVIAHLKSQLATFEAEQPDYERMRREIEEHFERFIHSLEVRRDTLTDQLEQIAQEQYNTIETTRKSLENCIHNCEEILKFGCQIYPSSHSTAEYFWQGVKNLSPPTVDLGKLDIQISFPNDILTIMKSYGKVIVKPPANVPTTSSISTNSSISTTSLPISENSNLFPSPPKTSSNAVSSLKSKLRRRSFTISTYTCDQPSTTIPTQHKDTPKGTSPPPPFVPSLVLTPAPLPSSSLPSPPSSAPARIPAFSSSPLPSSFHMRARTPSPSRISTSQNVTPPKPLTSTLPPTPNSAPARIPSTSLSTPLIPHSSPQTYISASVIATSTTSAYHSSPVSSSSSLPNATYHHSSNTTSIQTHTLHSISPSPLPTPSIPVPLPSIPPSSTPTSRVPSPTRTRTRARALSPAPYSLPSIPPHSSPPPRIIPPLSVLPSIPPHSSPSHSTPPHSPHSPPSPHSSHTSFPLSSKHVVPFPKVKMVSTITNTNVSPCICHDPKNSFFYLCVSRNIFKLTLEGEKEIFATNVPSSWGIAFYEKENMLFVAGYSGEIMKVNSSGNVSLFATVEIPHKDSQLTGIAINQQTGDIFVATGQNNSIFKITPKGAVLEFAGTSLDFNCPRGLYFDETNQKLLVCDSKNNSIKHLSLDGKVFAVVPVPRPVAVAIKSNSLLIVSLDNILIVATPQESGEYQMDCLAGDGKMSTKDGKAKECSFDEPVGIAMHEIANTCIITEWKGNIRKILFE